eukprot:jgi/Botrbrau1/18346/Bobra.0179s0071.1
MEATLEVPSDADRSIHGRDGEPLTLTRLGGSGDVLIILQANGFSGNVYEPLAWHLKSAFTCYSLGPRGQVEASSTLVGYDPNFATYEYAWDLLAVVDALSARGRCYALGHSLGGTTAIRAEAARPGTFKAILSYEAILVDPDTLPEKQDTKMADRARKRRRRFDSRSAADAAFRTRYPFKTWHPAAFEAYLKHGFRDSPDGGVELACSPDIEADSYLAVVHPPLARQAWEGLLRVACPVVVAGGDDPVSPFKIVAANLRPVAERLRHGHVERYHGLGHLGPMEDPAFMASRVLAMKAAASDSQTWGSMPKEVDFDVRRSPL